MLTQIVAATIAARFYAVFWHNPPATKHDRALGDDDRQPELRKTRHNHAPPGISERAGNQNREQLALWIFLIAVVFISLLAGYLLWAKLWFPDVRNG